MQVKGAAVHIASISPLVVAVCWLSGRLRRIRRPLIAVEGDHVTLNMHKRVAAELRSALPDSYRLVAATDTIEQFRMIKSAEEINLIGNAVDLASCIFPDVVQSIRAGVTESEIAAELEYRARRSGAEKMSFEPIVASGQNSALPHARPTARKIGRGFVVLDYGVILGGYCSDMTRTVWVGRGDKQARAVYSAVLEAQLAGIAAVRDGVEAQQVDAAAREMLRRHKLDRYFTHSLGHGVGLEIHEAPRLAKGQTQRLQAGMVVTIEPGVYIPGRGGVRIEDMVVVTQGGCKVLTPTAKELIIC